MVPLVLMTVLSGGYRLVVFFLCAAAQYSKAQSLRDGQARPQAHAEYVADLPEWLDQRADVMIEADGKERALLQFRSNPPRSS